METQNINENKINIIKKIIPKLNLTYINFKIVNSNIEILINLFIKIKKIYNELPKDLEFQNDIIDKKFKKTIYHHVYNFINNIDSQKLNKSKTLNKIFLLKHNNLYFFYLYKNHSDLEKDLNHIYYLAKIFFSMVKLFDINQDSNQTRYVIWLPINSDRDYVHEKIDEQKLNTSVQDFKAFTVSGVTYSGGKLRITLITRFEEIEKLLIHELIHNLHLDGSNYHDQNTNLIKEYNKTKQNQNYNYEYSIYESYTELLSTYLYLIFKNLNKSSKQIFKILLGQILIEIIYSYNTIVNLAKLNGYLDYNDFINKQEFYGSICFYEYYYVKGLLYNNLILTFPKNFEEYKQLYNNIILIISTSHTDQLLEQMFKIYQKQKNFKYIFN